MISQQHNNLQGSEEELSPTPAEEKQVSTAGEEKQTTSSEGRSQQAYDSPRRWIVVLFCILGIAIPMVTGSMLEPVGMIIGFIWGNMWLFFLFLLLMAVLVTLAAFLLGFAFRRWWAGLLVLVAWIVGQFASAVAFANWGAHFWDFERTSIIEALIVIIPLGVIGGLVGNAYRRRWEKRRQTTMSDRS